MSTRTAPTVNDVATGTWRLDPSRSSVEFHVPNFYGLMAVKGRFDRFHGTFDVSGPPAVALIVEADSVDTKNPRRDKHLRSGAFFDVANHPWVRFEADAVELDGEAMKVRGLLYAAGTYVPVEADVTVTAVGDELEIEAVALVDQRKLGMTFSPLGTVRAPSKLIVGGRLVRADAAG